MKVSLKFLKSFFFASFYNHTSVTLVSANLNCSSKTSMLSGLSASSLWTLFIHEHLVKMSLCCRLWAVGGSQTTQREPTWAWRQKLLREKAPDRQWLWILDPLAVKKQYKPFHHRAFKELFIFPQMIKHSNTSLSLQIHTHKNCKAVSTWKHIKALHNFQDKACKFHD